LECCLTECKRQLDHWREQGNDLRAALAEADLNDMLDRLLTLNRLRTTREQREL